MKASVAAIRAIGTEFIRRKVRELWLPYIAGAAIASALVIWLVHFSWWWLLVAVPVALAVIAGLIILIAASVLIHVFSPNLSATQHAGTKSYVDKLQRMSGVIATPPFWLIIRTLRDLRRPREGGFISTTANDSKTLRNDFQELKRLF